jgi:hypothetical protein
MVHNLETFCVKLFFRLYPSSTGLIHDKVSAVDSSFIFRGKKEKKLRLLALLVKLVSNLDKHSI